MNAQPLTDIELDKLTDVLKSFGDKRAMNLEMMDGFFAALICGPEIVLPSEYLPEIWGGDVVNEPIFQTKPILKEFISLVTQHWNAICRTLQSGEVFLPLLLDDENGVARANDWANGFMRGMGMRRDSWVTLMDDEEQAGSLVPILALAHENHPDPNAPIQRADQRRNAREVDRWRGYWCGGDLRLLRGGTGVGGTTERRIRHLPTLRA